MKERGIWLLLSSLMVVVLVLASCGPAEKKAPVVEEEEKISVGEVEEEEKVGEEEVVTAKEKTVTVTLEKLDGSTVKKEMEVPQYGGWVNAVPYWTVSGFDRAVSAVIVDPAAMLTHDVMLAYDWYRGPSGTEEFDMSVYGITEKYFGGCIAESWEQPDLETLIIKLKKGVRFHNKAPAYGRELTAVDVVYNLERCVGYSKCAKSYSPPGAAVEDTWRAKALDKYTVELKMPVSAHGYFAWFQVPFELYIYPKESVDAGIEDWRNSCGTGPYMLTDFVEGSTAKLERNPDFYLNDPFFPDNQLPYPDGVNLLYISDGATKVASLRTGKADRVYGVPREQALSLIKSNPELEYVKVREMSSSILVLNTQVEPFDDVNVRRAIRMAIDYDAIVNAFGGDADKFGWPTQVGKEAYVPLEEMSAEVQELYSHNVEKAKQLLADAGYPSGFKTSSIYHVGWGLESIAPILQANFAEIGVDLEIRQIEQGVMRGQMYSLSYGPIAIYGAGNARPWGAPANYYAGGVYNYGGVTDETPKNMYDEIQKIADLDERYDKIKEMHEYCLENFWPGLVVRHAWTLWQPWLKGYSGEDVTTLAFGVDSVYRYVWVDQELKESMGK